MKCVVLTAPGEVIEGALHAKHLGYEVEIYPVTRHEAALTDTRYLESALYYRKLPEDTEKKPHVRSLRASYIRALCDERYNNDDDIIFCESDFSTTIPASDLKRIVHKALSQYPDADIIRPFHYCEWKSGLQKEGSVPDNLGFDKMRKTSIKDLNSAEFWGTHALIVPAKSRKKIAQVFSEYRLPTDIALSLANKKGAINIYVCTHNFFYQIRRESKPSHDSRVAGILSLHSEENDCQSQIRSLINQDYKNFHLHVFTKKENGLKHQFHDHIEEGRLTIHQIQTLNSNLSDYVKGIDIITLLDARTLYVSNYISNIVRYHSFFPQDVSSVYVGGTPMADRMKHISFYYTIAAPLHPIKTFLNNEHLTSTFPLTPAIEMFDRTVFVDLFDSSGADTQHNGKHCNIFLRHLYHLVILSVLFILNVKDRVVDNIFKPN